jgi:glycosyltransferase involved in cell wall biosynthesis
MTFRVLLSAYACRPGVGTEPGLGWNWASELAKAGATVWVLTRPDNKEAIEGALSSIPHVNLHFIYVEHPPLGKFLQHLPWGRNWKYVEWQEQAYEVAKKLDKEIDFDIAHHVSYGSLLMGSRLWRLRCPFIFGPAGGGQTAPAGFRRHLRGGWLFESIRTVIVRHLYAYVLNARSTAKGAALVLVANRDTEAAVRYLGANEIRVMTTVGLPAEQIRTHSPVASSREEPLRILWVASLQPFKGLLLALEAMALVGVDTAWRLTIIGDGKQGAFLFKWVRMLSLEGKVDWRGRIPWADVQTSYDHADLLLFTSLRDTDGGQLLEAMGHGVPILTLDHQGAATLVPDSAGIKVPVSTPKETAACLARSIERLAADRDLLLKMGEAAIEVARSHAWKRKAMDALKIYSQLIENNALREL